MKELTPALTLDSFPDIKHTLQRGFMNYEEFLQFLCMHGALTEKEKFNDFVCEQYVLDDIYALSALAMKYTKIYNKNRAEILRIAFNNLYDNFIEMYKKINGQE